MTIDENALKILIQEAYAEGYAQALGKTKPRSCWLNVSEAAQIAGTKPSTLRDHIYLGKLDKPTPHRPSKNGSNIKVHISSLKKYMNAK